jgi:hypothetical protein
MRKKFSVSFFLVFFNTIAWLNAQSAFGEVEQPTSIDSTYIFAGLAIFAVMLTFLLLNGDAVKNQITNLAIENENVYLSRAEKVREHKRRKEEEREAAKQAKIAQDAEAKAAIAKANAEKAIKNAKENEAKARKAAKAALDKLTEEEKIIAEYLTDDLIIKEMKGKHVIERLKRDVGMPNHSDDSEMVSAGKMYKYGDGKQIYVQLTDLNAGKIEARMKADAASAKARKEAAELEERNRKIKVVLLWILAIVSCLIFLTVAK